MFTVRQTLEFQAWLDALKDMRAQVRIAARLRLAEAGNLGDWKAVGGDVSEMRVDVGPGYRLYFTRRASIVMVISRAVTSRVRRETSSERKGRFANWSWNHE